MNSIVVGYNTNVWEGKILIEANSETGAIQKVEKIGLPEEVNYKAEGVDEVSWKYKITYKIFEISEVAPSDKSEIFPRFLTLDEINSLSKSIDD